MLIKKIRFANYEKIEDIEDIENYNLDVFVDAENDFTYVLTVITPQNLLYLMEENQKNFWGPSGPYVIVKKITKDIVEEAIKAYAAENDGYWLKFYYFSSNIEIGVFEKLQTERIQLLKEEEELDRLDPECSFFFEESKELDNF